MSQPVTISPAAARAVAGNTPFRRARTCYGHLAGVAGVALLDALLQRGLVEPVEDDRGRAGLRLSRTGAAMAGPLSLPARSGAGRPCLDWTERRPHLGGPLGRALTDALRASGVLLPGNRPRHVRLLGSVESWLDRCQVAQ